MLIDICNIVKEYNYHEKQYGATVKTTDLSGNRNEPCIKQRNQRIPTVTANKEIKKNNRVQKYKKITVKKGTCDTIYNTDY